MLAPRAVLRSGGGGDGYGAVSMRPLHVLVYLLPLVVLYEAGSVAFLTDWGSGVSETIRARAILSGFFQAFGAVGLFLPGLALVLVLLVWHVMRGDAWRVRWPVLAVMLAESCAWMVPLLVFSVLLRSAVPGASGALAGSQEVDALLSMPVGARLTISIGAGLYEELLFRMIGIAALHALFVDLCRVRDQWGRVLAVALSAVAFAVYHDVSAPGAGVDWWRAFFFLCSGAYFGALYLARGFGIVVATHALYDVVVLVGVPWAQGAGP